MSKLKETLIFYHPFISAIVDLFDPFVEAAVHDLEEGRIIALYNAFSRRRVGEKSPIKELKVKIEEFPDYFPPYTKRNWDGRELKCTSITLRDPIGRPIGLICFNVDTSVFRETQRLLDAFLKIKPGAANPVEACGRGCEEQVHALIEHFAKQQQLALSALDRKQKKSLIEFLYQKGAFNYKNAVPLVAKTLHLSRASIYNYINEIGEKL